MPASSLSKIAIQLSRFANFQAAHQGANAFRNSATSSGSSSASGAAASTLSAGAGSSGAGAGGAKFHAGRGAHFTYTNSGGRAVVQAGSSSSNDSSNLHDDDDEHHHHHHLHHHHPSGRFSQRRNSTATHSTAVNLRKESSTGHADLSNTTLLSNQSLQSKFKSAFASSDNQQGSAVNLTESSSASAELYRDLVDANHRGDRVAVTSLVEAYRRLPHSHKTTAGFNAALQAQLSVRHPGESLRPVRETHKDMLEAGCLPNSNTSAVLVKALCARDEEKHADQELPGVATDQEASSEAWRVMTTSPGGLRDITAYNALLSRCAAKGDVERAQFLCQMITTSADVQANAATYVSMLQTLAVAGKAVESVSPAVVGEYVAAATGTLEQAVRTMRSPQWINDEDDSVFVAFIQTVDALQAPEEAIALFERMLNNEGSLPSPSARVTEAVVAGFAAAGDFETARVWMDNIEAINAASASGDNVVDAPDFAGLRAQCLSFSQAKEDHESSSSPVSSTSTAPTSVEPVEAEESERKQSQPELQQQPQQQLQHCFDDALGERVKSLLRARRQQQQQPNLEAAYRLLVTQAADKDNLAAPEVYAQLLNLYGRSGRLDRVEELRTLAHSAIARLADAPDEHLAAWLEVEDNVISALAHGGDIEAAHAARHVLLGSGYAPSANAYAALISSIRDATDEALVAEQLWDESQRWGVRPNIYLVNTVISRLGRARRADRALQLYNSLPQLGLKPTTITYGASLNCAVRVGDIATAESIFAAMESDPSFVAKPPGYNSMIQFFTYTKPDRAKALHYWEKMQAKGVQPSSHTYKLLLDVHGSIQPVDVAGMNAVFLRLLRDHANVQVAGPHWAALISCHGADLAKCRDIFHSIPLKTGSRPDAVAYEALLAVYARHARSDLIDELIAEMLRMGVAPTAYVANHAIEGYSNDGTWQGLAKARTIFLAMSQPPAGVASAGNHPIPRHHGRVGATSVQTAGGAQSQGAAPPAIRQLPIEEVLAAGSGPSSTFADLLYSDHSTDASWAVGIDFESSLTLLHTAFAQVHPEPSTYERMIRLEVAAGDLCNARCVVERMEERAFPPALVLKARALLPKVHVV
ncbi:unnamed protein product [Jaminaea pallidilutea]